MKILAWGAIPALLISFFMSSCSTDNNLVTGEESPVPVAAVSGCSVTGSSSDWNVWKSDILTVLNNCETEPGASSPCSDAGEDLVKDFHFGHNYLGGINIASGCNYPASTINAHIGTVASTVGSGRPAGGYENFERCDYRIDGYQYFLNTTLSHNPYWVFTARVRYKKYCCPLKEITVPAEIENIRLVKEDEEGPNDPETYVIYVNPKSTWTGTGIRIRLTDDQGGLLEAGEFTQWGESNDWYYVPTESNLGVQGDIEVTVY